MNFDKFYSTLTPEERAYFIATTDIFHDTPYNVIGRPSSARQLQNTTVVNLEKTISKDTFGLGPGTWDCNIVSLPFVTKQVLMSDNDYGFYLNQATSPVFNTWGGVTYWGVPSGTDTVVPSSLAPAHTLDATDFLYPGIIFGNSSPPVSRLYYEVLAIGMEIWNTTPQLYRGGSVIRYRVPTQGRKSTIGVDAEGFASEDYEMYSFPLPPSSSEEAMQYPDSILADATEGSYQIHTIQDDESDFRVTGNDRVHFRGVSVPSPTVINGNSWVSARVLNASTYDYDPPLVRADMDIVGSYFTGLSEQSTLTVRYRLIISTVPSSDQAQLVSLAKLNPQQNYKLDALISHVQQQFLPGVPVSMNPKGEWFKQVLKFARKAIPKVTPIIQDVMTGDVPGAITKTSDLLIKELNNTKTKTGNNTVKVDQHQKDIADILKRVTTLETELSRYINNARLPKTKKKQLQ